MTYYVGGACATRETENCRPVNGPEDELHPNACRCVEQECKHMVTTKMECKFAVQEMNARLGSEHFQFYVVPGHDHENGYCATSDSGITVMGVERSKGWDYMTICKA